MCLSTLGGTWKRINQLIKAYVSHQWKEHGGGLISLEKLMCLITGRNKEED
jgi:hypothetical protein